MGHGVSLVAHNPSVSEQQKHELEELMAPLGCFHETIESEFRYLAGLTSSGPAVISILLEHLLASNTEGSKTSNSESSKLLNYTVEGVIKLIREQKLSHSELQKLVATPKGCLLYTSPSPRD